LISIFRIIQLFLFKSVKPDMKIFFGCEGKKVVDYQDRKE